VGGGVGEDLEGVVSKIGCVDEGIDLRLREVVIIFISIFGMNCTTYTQQDYVTRKVVGADN